ncbi:unnamed protein product, partial [Rotaria sp. Silwood2]
MLLNVKKSKAQPNGRLLEQLSFILKCIMNKLMFGLKKLHGDFKMECLEALITNITELDSAYLEVKAAGILDILIH